MKFVVGMLILTVLLMVVVLTNLVSLTPNPSLMGVLRISIAIFGLGAVALRRTRFSAMRLRDVGALRGTSGLIRSLEKTTVYVALLGGAIALMGTVIGLMSDWWQDEWLNVVALAVLFYAYPRKAAWESVVDSVGRAAVLEDGRAKGNLA